MSRLTGVGLAAIAAGVMFAQSGEPAPKFEIADVHVSAKSPNLFMRISPPRGGRYEIKSATMVDLVRTAYSVDADKVLGGPSWLEMNRYDVIAKLPPDSNPDMQKLMLMSLLEDRFKLAAHKETKPLPTYALVVGKKPLIKESDGAGDTGCRIQSGGGSAAPGEGGGMQLMMATGGGAPQRIVLGPGMTVQYQCRNMTMAAFAEGLRGMMGSNVGTNQVLDQTGLKGTWNFDLKWSLQLNGLIGGGADGRISSIEAIDKQLGLKLEEKQIPTAVVVVDAVNEKPSDNPPGVAEALPSPPAPTEFEVADVKPTDPSAGMGGRFNIQPGGRLVAQGMPMRFLIGRAFSSAMMMMNNSDQIVGLPKWVDTERFDINAKGPSMGPSAPPLDMEAIMPMMRSMLVERFKLAYHTEERPVSAYTLVAAKPKMKKADPASRTFCKTPNAPPGAPPGSRVLNCQNITMAQFADRLQGLLPGTFTWPVLDATGIEGGWDFTLTFSQNMPMMNGMPGMPGMARGGGDAPAAPGAAVPEASAPVSGYTLFEAIEKQLGLKLESQKRTMPVIVVDHLEQKPTEN